MSTVHVRATGFRLAHRLRIFCALLCLVIEACAEATTHFDETVVSPKQEHDGGQKQVLVRLGVASCNKHDAPQGYWQTMAERMFADTGSVSLSPRPLDAPALAAAPHPPVSTLAVLSHSPPRKLDAFVWLGDVVYADSALMPGVWYASPHALVESKYRTQKSNPMYRAFCSASTRRVFGIWDDHDYGMNDGGKEFTDKEFVRRLFLDFLDVPETSIRRTQPGGIYAAETLSFDQVAFPVQSSSTVDGTGGGAALKSEVPHKDDSMAILRRHFTFAVCLILLDVRYSRDPISSDRSGDILGEDQWNWLDAQLGQWFPRTGSGGTTRPDEVSPPSSRGACLLTLIGSGIQVSLDEKPTEHWANYPASRNRLLALLRKHDAERVAFLSGDVHLGEIGVDDTPDAIAALGYPIVELTSSGLTHSSASIPFVPKLFLQMFPSHRRRGVYLGKNFGTVSLVATPGSECRSAPDDPLDGIALEVQVHSLEAESAGTKENHRLRDANYVAVHQRICLRSLQLSHHFNKNHRKAAVSRTPPTGSLMDAVEATTVVSYPETPPAAVKSILVATQYYLFPRLRFHQLINLYVGAALAVIGLTSFWLLVVLGRAARRRLVVLANYLQRRRLRVWNGNCAVSSPAEEPQQPVVAKKKHQ